MIRSRHNGNEPLKLLTKMGALRSWSYSLKIALPNPTMKTSCASEWIVSLSEICATGVRYGLVFNSGTCSNLMVFGRSALFKAAKGQIGLRYLKLLSYTALQLLGANFRCTNDGSRIVQQKNSSVRESWLVDQRFTTVSTRRFIPLRNGKRNEINERLRSRMICSTIFGIVGLGFSVQRAMSFFSTWQVHILKWTA